MTFYGADVVGDSRQLVMVFDHVVATLADSVTAGAHKHGALQLSISLDCANHAVGPRRDDRREGVVHLVGSNRSHTFDGSGGVQLLLWITPESSLGHSLACSYLDEEGFGILPDEIVGRLPTSGLRRAFEEGRPGGEVLPLLEQTMEAFVDSPNEAAGALHPSIRRAAEILHSLDIKTISAQELAGEVGLSVSRFQHLFSRDLGIPLRPYLQWLRLVDAMTLLVSGQTVTEAAAAAGFADASHLNRVMQQFFGFAPLDLVKRSDITIELLLAGRR